MFNNGSTVNDKKLLLNATREALATVHNIDKRIAAGGHANPAATLLCTFTALLSFLHISQAKQLSRFAQRDGKHRLVCPWRAQQHGVARFSKQADHCARWHNHIPRAEHQFSPKLQVFNR
ncbi:MAG: hypothetical protein LRY31_04215, partial [Burkholderiaceae bacterium]|nr:hypothetical protein [Burkholderiaceae bacterium]